MVRFSAALDGILFDTISQAMVWIDFLSLEANMLFGDYICTGDPILMSRRNVTARGVICDVTIMPAQWSWIQAIRVAAEAARCLT